MPKVTVIIPTLNRLNDLIRCIRSFELVRHLSADMIVLDDGSDPVVEPAVRDAFGSDFPLPIRFFRHEQPQGIIRTCNELVRRAEGEYVLLMNDDAYLIDAESVEQSVRILDADSKAGAIAMSQVTRDDQQFSYQPGFTLCSAAVRLLFGEKFKSGNSQPPSLVRSFYGYGALIRRSTFIELGGYREVFFYYAEEPEYCKRMLGAGYHVVYVPEARVVHEPNPTSRSMARITAYMWRNGCYSSTVNEPWYHAMVSIPVRLLQFFSYRLRLKRRIGRDEARGWGLRWVLREFLRDFPRLLKQRQPLSYRTIARWRKLRQPQPYTSSQCNWLTSSGVFERTASKGAQRTPVTSSIESRNP